MRARLRHGNSFFASHTAAQPSATAAVVAASRSATKLYRTTPLRGACQHAPYSHDVTAATPERVEEIYNAKHGLGLLAQEIADLAQYLRAL